MDLPAAGCLRLWTNSIYCMPFKYQQRRSIKITSFLVGTYSEASGCETNSIRHMGPGAYCSLSNFICSALQEQSRFVWIGSFNYRDGTALQLKIPFFINIQNLLFSGRKFLLSIYLRNDSDTFTIYRIKMAMMSVWLTQLMKMDTGQWVHIYPHPRLYLSRYSELWPTWRRRLQNRLLRE